MPADYFSIRWTGYVQPLFSDTYYVCVWHNDAAALWVNNQLLFNVNDPNGVENCGAFAMTAGDNIIDNCFTLGIKLTRVIAELI